MTLTTGRTLAATVLFTVAALFAGCIVSDQLTTITIHPDGSADLVQVQLNVHSSETGDKADEDLRGYTEQFNAQKDTDHVRITEAGGQIQESRWIRSEPPYANFLVAKLPTAAALEKAFTFKSDQGESLVTAQFTREGTRRKFSLMVTLPRDQVEGVAAEQSVEELRSNQANGLSETRFAVAAGKIVEAHHFTVASDQQSALLEAKAILEALRSQRQVEAFVEWEVTGK